MKFHQIPVGPMQNFTYLIGDDQTGIAMVVDPSWDLQKILDTAKQEHLQIKFIVNTHGHQDHTRGNADLARATGAKIAAHELAGQPKDIALTDGSILEVGALRIEVIHAPGHSPDGICLLVERKLLTGDTLFVGECGRTDGPGGSSADMYESLFNKLRFDADIEVYPGHDYGDRPSSTIGHERKNNYTLKPRSKEDFIRFMAEP